MFNSNEAERDASMNKVRPGSRGGGGPPEARPLMPEGHEFYGRRQSAAGRPEGEQ